MITADNVATAGDTGNPGTTWLYIGRMDTAAFQMTWNSSLLACYPLPISRNAEDSSGTPLSYAALALPPDFSIIDASQRRVYASWSDGTGGNTNDDVYRLDDVTVFRLEAGNGMEYVGTSLAYHGTLNSGKLMAEVELPAGLHRKHLMSRSATLLTRNPECSPGRIVISRLRG
ncbi:hypothetical protein ACFLVE_00695 [Chloroflexota bacterium]